MTPKYIPHFLIAVLVGFVSHELAHFAMGQALGYDMTVSINKAGLAAGAYTNEVHRQLVTAAGPLATLVMAGLAFWLVYAREAKWAFPFLFFAFMMRVMAAAVSIANPNDEAALSASLGIGTWTLPFLTIGLLLGLVFVAGRKIELGWKSWLFSWIVTSVGITLIIFTEPYWPVLGV